MAVMKYNIYYVELDLCLIRVIYNNRIQFGLIHL